MPKYHAFTKDHPRDAALKTAVLRHGREPDGLVEDFAYNAYAYVFYSDEEKELVNGLRMDKIMDGHSGRSQNGNDVGPPVAQVSGVISAGWSQAELW